ncbi:MAG TPA: DEAD/DEAH box helicase [Nocardioides bacterium]|nr:DEAD/DEAH box helicase [Nocardioides sp.]
MDRALDAELLADALGRRETGPLPTAQELADLVAEVEVQAIIVPGDLDARLLQTAWYLHGIASAANAADLYTSQRQERAFAVSAHIFDLALNTPGRTEHERLTLAFAAQVGYRRSQLDPNAVAVWRRVDGLLDFPPLAVQIEESVDGQALDEVPVDSSPDYDKPDEEADGDESVVSGRGRPTGEPDGDDLDEVTHDHFETMALRAGIAFLGLNLARSGFLIQQWHDQATAMATTVAVDNLVGTMFGPAEQVVVAVAEMVEFLRFGNAERLNVAREALRTVIDRRAGVGDHDALWVAAHLLHVADGLAESSIWAVLPPGSPDTLAQAFTIGSPPVLTLWPPQRELLARTTAGPLDPETKRLLLSVPTSAGKTLMAQIMICHHLATQTGDVCYVTSMRSLGREMRQALSSRLRVLQRGIGGDLPDFARIDLQELLDFFEDWNDNAVEIMTPERLAQMLRRDTDAVLERFSMFVVDEAHMLGQPGRGLLLESLLATLTTSDARLILLSGVMGNADQVATWLDDTEEGVLFTSGWRGPRRLHALLYTGPQWHQGTTTIRPKAKRWTIEESFPMVGELKIRPAEGRIRELYANKVGEFVRYRDNQGNQTPAPSTPFYKQCARTAVALMHAGSLLMIVSQRAYARDAAKEIAAQLPPRTQTAELADILSERLGAAHPLIECVRHGVGYHHAGLPTDVLEALEQATRDEELVALVATTTLTDGVNLPVRTVLISESKYTGQDPRQQMDAAQLLNAVGRAGRAGRETEGWIVLALNQQAADDDFDLLRPAAADLSVVSTLTDSLALEELAQVEQLIAATTDAIFDLKDTDVGKFVAFVWYVLNATEMLAAIGSETNVGRSIRRLLAFTQLPAELADQWLNLAEQVERVYEATSQTSRRRWTVAGTTLGSARSLESVAARLAEAAIRTTAAPPANERGHAQTPITDPGPAEPGSSPHDTDDPVTVMLDMDQTLRILEETDTFAALFKLPECPRDWSFKQTPKARVPIDVTPTYALRRWLTGDDIPTLAGAILPTVSDIGWRLEQTVDAISETFEHFLSWTIGVALEQANDILAAADANVRFSDTFAYFIRYGVDTHQALNLLVRGVRSRRLAYLVGKQAHDRGLAGADLRDWLIGLHLDGWKSEFNANPREVEDLAEYVRSPRASVLRAALEATDAKAELRYPLEPPPQTSLPVHLIATTVDQPIEVWAVGQNRYRIGVISAAHHSDVHALHNSALPYSAATDGTTVEFRITLG